MDNASFHRGKKVRDALPDLQKQNLHLITCPHGPELNDIERLFRKAKHEAMPRRCNPTNAPCWPPCMPASGTSGTNFSS